MKFEAGARYIVYDLKGIVKGELRFEDGHEVWPAGVHGWKHALDCTVEPYAERDLDENTAFAERVNKFNVVMRLE
jgi:hypothetical protein